MAIKDDLRLHIADAIEAIEQTKDLELRRNALGGITDILSEFHYELKLEIGELTALITIENNNKQGQ